MPAAVTTTTPSRIDAKLLSKAVDALLKHHNETKNGKALLGDDSVVHIQFGLDKVPERSSAKPRRVDIPHALWKTSDDDGYDGIQEPTVCLIVKEDSKEWVQELISAFPKEMGLVKKVLGLDSLRKKHGSFEQQRALLHRFDVFMADDRILPMLGKSLGKHFFAVKKQPIPVPLGRRTTLPVVILQSLRSTFWYLSEGTCLTVKAGTTGMSTKQIAENVAAICAHVPSKIPRRWANVRSIAVKTSNSMALPIYNKTPAELKDIAKLAGITDEEYVKEDPKPVMSETTTPATKKRKSVKSPLLKALKKQQQEEAIAEDESGRREESPKKKRKVSVDEEIPSTTSISTKKSRVEGNDEEKDKATKKVVTQEDGTPKDKTSQNKAVKRGGSDVVSSKKKPKIQVDAETPKSKSHAAEDVTSGKKKQKTQIDAETPKSKSPAAEGTKSDISSNKKSPARETKKGDVASSKKSPASETKVGGATSSKKGLASEIKKRDANSGDKSPAVDVKKSESSKKSPSTMKSDVGLSKKASKSTPKKEASTSNGAPGKDEAFIASKKFVGSKSGYAFKSGSKGVGYYVDVKPKVNPMVIEALLRSSPKNRNGGGSGRKATKTGRGRR